MAYKVEFSEKSKFTEILLNTIQKWCSEEPDVFLISSEGLKIYTQKILLSFYSQTLRDVLNSINNNSTPGISVPIKAENISILLKVLETGLVISRNKDAFLEVGEAASILGIAFNSADTGFDDNSDESEKLFTFDDNFPVKQEPE